MRKTKNLQAIAFAIFLVIGTLFTSAELTFAADEENENTQQEVNANKDVPTEQGKVDENVSDKIIVQKKPTLAGNTAKNERAIGNLVITKVDAVNQSVLEGAVFELYNRANELIATKTTDADGKIVFEDLSFDRYTLKEKAAPEGYVVDIDETGKEVIVNSSPTEITIENKKITRSFKLTKVDSRDTTLTLPGAVFELSYKTPASNDYIVVNGMEELTSDANGEIFVEDLLIGDYRLIEVTAPVDYVLDSTPIDFTIEEKQTVIRVLQQTNAKNPPPAGLPDASTYPDELVIPVELINPDNVELESEDQVVVATTSEEPVAIEDGVKGTYAPSKSSVSILPQTGEAFSSVSVLGGLTTILLGAWLLFGSRTRKQSTTF